MYERLKTSDREDIHIFVTATNAPFFRQNLWILEDLFKKSLLAKDGKYSLFDIQSELLGHIVTADDARRKYLSGKGRFAKAISNLSKNNASLERIKQAQTRLDDMHNSSEAARLFVSQLRSIGDGIAWRFLNYDRAALRILAEHDYISAPIRGRGLLAEIEKFAYFASQGRPVLINSITNFLRVGDLTTYDESSNTYNLVEVKAGNMQTPKTRRQTEKRKLVQKGLDETFHSIFPDISITKIMSKSPLLTYANGLDKVMSEANQKLASSRKYGEYLSLCAFSLRKLLELPEEEANQILAETITRLFSITRSRKDILLPLMSNVFRTVHFSRMLAPYTIFPIDQNHRFSLLAGDFLIFSLLNISGLIRWLEKRGWEVEQLQIPHEIPNDPESPYLPVFQVHKPNDPWGVEIPLDIICLAAMELWMPESIERLILAGIKQRNTKSGFTCNFPNIGKYAWD